MLSKQITRLRKISGKTQMELARELNVSPSTIGMYEQGRRVPSLAIIVQISNIFQVSLDYLVTGKEHT